MAEISVVTPVLNGRRHIAECISSVAAQEDVDLEHIIVDGGSTDGTLELVESFCSSDSRVCILRGPDRGQSDALNRGVSAARADVIGILNCDDLYQPKTLRTALRHLREMRPPAIVVGNCKVINEVRGDAWLNRPVDLRFESLLLGPEYVEFPGNPSAYFYHKVLHQSIGPYDIDDHFAMDLDFILGAVRVAEVRHVDETWGVFRYHAGTKTYRDRVSGADKERRGRVLRRHMSHLTWWGRQRVYRRRLIMGAKQRYWHMAALLRGRGARE